MVRPSPGAVDDLFRQKSLQEIHGILQTTRAQVEAKKTELRELVGDHYRSVLESSDHIRAMSECAVQVAQGAEKLETLIATMRELAAKPPQPDDQCEPETEFSLCEHVMEVLEMPDKVRSLVAELSFVKAAKAALVDAPALHAKVQQRLRVESLPGFDPQGLISQQAAAFRSLPRQVAGGCVDAFATAELTPAAAAEAFVAHLVLNETAASSLLRRFIECRSNLLRDILEGSGAAFGGDSKDGLLQRLCAAAMAFEGTIVVASSLCSPGAGGAPPPLLATALASLDTSNEILRQKAEMLFALFHGGGSMATELSPLGVQFVRSWVPEEGRDSGKTFIGRVEALISGHLSTSCAELGQLQRAFTQRIVAFRGALAENIGLGEAREWPAIWAGACKLFSPGRGVCQDCLSALSKCVEQSCAQLARESLRELKLVLVDPGEVPEGEEMDESRRAEQLSEMRGHCQANISSFDEQFGTFLDDVAQLSEEIPSKIRLAVLEGLEQQLTAALQALQSSVPRVAPLWPAKDVQVPSWKVQRAAINGALALEVLLAAMDCDKGTRLGTALQAARTSGDAALSAKATAITTLLQQHVEEVNCTWARVVVSAGEPVATLGSFWKLADDEVGPACGWGSAKFPAREGEAKSVAVPIQSSAFVFERLAFAAQSLSSAKLTGHAHAAAAALKAALAECFAAAYEDKPSDLARLKRSGMSHLLQWLFDLNFLRIALSAAASPGNAALEMLRGLLSQTESIAFSDPVDRVLYQDLLKASVNNHVQETKVLLAPFFQNELHGFQSQAQPGVTRSNSSGKQGLAAPGSAGNENEGFELQTSYTAPLRPVLPRFPLLPVAMNVTARSDLDRLRLEPRAKAEMRPQSLMQQAGGLVGGLGGLGSRFGTVFGKQAQSEAMNV